MGPEINTAGNDMFATFAKDGGLFYATDGKPGLGGLDIFKLEKVSAEMKWQNPTNLGVPINSVNHDYALIEHTDRKGYFTSERKSENGENKPDIWAYILPPNLYDLKVIVSDVQDRNEKIKDAKLVITSSEGQTWEGYTNKDGSVFWDKRPNGDRFINEEASYTIQVSKDGYYEDTKGSKFTTVGLDYPQNFVIEMALLPKKPIRLPEVRYPLAEWTLLVDSTINSKDSLLFVLNLLNDNPGLVLELSSHTDARGATASNQVLSENRAHQCYVFLVQEKGIDPRRIIPVGKGENEPRKVFKNGDEYSAVGPKDAEGNLAAGYVEVALTEALINSYKVKNRVVFDRLHQLNRRTEGKVLSLDFDPATAPEASKDYLEFKTVPKM
jgi:peptidoglycan-associated lipoprotein